MYCTAIASAIILPEMFCCGEINSLMDANYASNVTITMKTTPTYVIFLVYEHVLLRLENYMKSRIK